MQLETALHILGIEGLRPFQEEALNTLLADRSLLTLMPTSAGKSLIFTTFAMVQERLTIVIEPHLALELDQVRQLQGKGVAAACLNSLQSSAERKSVLAQIEQGELLLLFITPEMLQNRKVQTALRQSDLAGVMIDEVHCICKQGPGFREDYLRIRDFVQNLPTPPVVGAFTATATPTTEQYILEKLGIEGAHVIRGGVTRDNIELRVIEVGHGLGGRKASDLIELRKREIICNRLRKHKGDRVIIYTNTINRRLIKENQMDLKGAELKERLHALEALHDYACENHKCRWGMIREFFGEKSGKRCKKRCDNCKNG
ncbi:DEAD/DEAH box helicase [Agathobaculum sp.]|uniref:DEAD/DEAH box helicase n=1 Tax=Agathobaculum sp. TaxID=2048138 RepID=UPI003AB78B45